MECERVHCSTHLGSWHGREGVGGSENRLVVHHGLGGHHWYPAHLTHLGGNLVQRRLEEVVVARSDLCNAIRRPQCNRGLSSKDATGDEGLGRF